MSDTTANTEDLENSAKNYVQQASDYIEGVLGTAQEKLKPAENNNNNTAPAAGEGAGEGAAEVEAESFAPGTQTAGGAPASEMGIASNAGGEAGAGTGVTRDRK